MRRWAVVPIVLLLAAGCDFSHVKANQTIVISGRALSATGQPLADVDVHLYKEPDVGEVVIGSVLALGSLGTICLLPEAPAICDQGRSTSTGADGRFTFTVKGSDTQGLIGDASTLDVFFADPDGGALGAGTTLRFKAQTTKVRLPAVRLWSARLRVAEHAAAPPSYGLAWARASRAYGSDVNYSVQLLNATDGSQWWSQPASAGRARIDARIVEDQPADAAVTARANLHGTDVVYLSARRQVQPIAGAPPSRHRPCSAVTGRKRLATVAQRPCAVTDGDLAAPARLTGRKHKVATGVVVDLGRTRPVSLVVARGVAGTVVVEVSRNGTSFRKVGTGGASVSAVELPGGTVARYVRVRSDGGLDESMLTEVSAW
jgi:hypothetical protein